MKNARIIFIFFLFSLLFYLKGVCSSRTDLYVDLKAVSPYEGTYEHPFKDIQQAKQFIRNNRKILFAERNGGNDVMVNIRQGVYRLGTEIKFDEMDGGDGKGNVCYRAIDGEKVVITGGEELSGKWVRTGSANVWKLDVSQLLLKNNLKAFRSLYLNGRRIPRARSDKFLTAGPLPEFSKSYGRLDFLSLRKLYVDSISAFCGFLYENGDLEDISEGEVLVYNSWDASWQTILRNDINKKIIFFKNPTNYPIGFFSNRMKYYVENNKKFMKKDFDWVLDQKTKELFLYFKGDLSSKDFKFEVPVVEKLLTLIGRGKDKKLKGLQFRNIIFSTTASSWGINDRGNELGITVKNKNPWLDLSEGFSSRQAALASGEAILLKYTDRCVFDSCSFTGLGNYALRIGEFSNNDKITNCRFINNGGGGVIVGFDYKGTINLKWDESIAPKGNVVEGCIISNSGWFFISSVGIGVMQANNTLIRANRIQNMPYSGISVGWTWGMGDNYTYSNNIENNIISNVMTELADGGGIYTLGKQTGTIYAGNVVESIKRSKDAIGGDNNGFFFDEGSSGFQLRNNVVKGLETDKLYRFNKTKKSFLFWDRGINNK